MKSVNKEVLDFLEPFDPAVRDLALGVRKLVLQTVPDATEQVHRPWKTISYGAGGKFCAIAPHKAWVNLQFHAGPLLSDPDGLLEGTGKTMRHVKISARNDLARRGVQALIQEAVAKARK